MRAESGHHRGTTRAKDANLGDQVGDQLTAGLFPSTSVTRLGFGVVGVAS
jgi:hypothetical protein